MPWKMSTAPKIYCTSCTTEAGLVISQAPRANRTTPGSTNRAGTPAFLRASQPTK